MRPEELNRRSTERNAEPFREADLMNAGEQGGKPKEKQSLFSRVTGLGLNHTTKAAPAKPSEPSLVRSERPTPSVAPATQSPASMQRPAAAPQPQPVEKDLAPSKAEEEMLEIPAFLRRQAN